MFFSEEKNQQTFDSAAALISGPWPASVAWTDHFYIKKNNRRRAASATCQNSRSPERSPHTLLNTGTITGGTYYGTGVSFGGVGTVLNHGTIEALAASVGINLAAGATVANTAMILGGGGAQGETGAAGSGAAAINAVGAAYIANSFTITGGGAGGTGLATLSQGGTVTNIGAIKGGAGGAHDGPKQGHGAASRDGRILLGICDKASKSLLF
jgi:hypothetical protein